MASNLRIYRHSDLICLTGSGGIDLERSKEMVRELAVAASFHRDCDILVDLRLCIVQETIGDHLELALELANYQSIFTGKVAIMVPNDLENLSGARQLLACLSITDRPFRFEVFTSFEDAINWLSEITELDGTPI